MTQWVEISFDCLPLRTLPRLDIPLDASPKFRQRCENIQGAIDKHGTHNSYYLYNARCLYHLSNHPDIGMLEFSFEGTVLTDEDDLRSRQCDLQVELTREVCDWLTSTIRDWFADTVPRSVAIEFDRYIEAGDLEKTRQRIEQVQQASDDADGFMGMYL
jgi:hypothetical protein